MTLSTDIFPATLLEDAASLLKNARANRVKIATAESCTGGLLAGLLTAIPGSSEVFERGYVTYSNEAKREELRVPATMLAEHGAVSQEVAVAMAQGAIAHSRADVALAITGIAGPDSDNTRKPVGLVHIGLAHKNGETHHRRYNFTGSRGEIRMAAVAAALALLKENV